MGRFEESDAELAMIRGLDPEEQVWILPDVYAWRGDNDEFFQMIQKENDDDPMGNSGLVFQPNYAGLHSDPRWAEWRELIGMSEERLDAIDFDPKLPQ